MKDTYKYQMVTVLNPKTEEKEKEKILGKVASWVEENGATVANKDHMGVKELAYEVKGLSKGDFWILDVESSSSLKLKEFNLFLNREPNVIRYLILKQ